MKHFDCQVWRTGLPGGAWVVEVTQFLHDETGDTWVTAATSPKHAKRHAIWILNNWGVNRKRLTWQANDSKSRYRSVVEVSE